MSGSNQAVFDAVANTSAAWFLTPTLSQICSILPLASISYVLRTMPWYERPMNFFICHAP
jgi:hypothetical protein